MKGIRFATILLALCCASATAAPPSQLPLQGVLRSSAGSSVDGTFDLKVALYAASDATEALFEEPHPGTVVSAGVFDLVVGSVKTMDIETLSGAAELWVGFKVEAEPELPRKRLLSVPYALFAGRALVAEKAKTADTASVLDCSGCITNTHLAGGVLPDLGPYAKTTDLAAYAKTADLGVYAKTTDLEPLAKTTDLEPFAETADLADVAFSGAYKDLSGGPDLSGYAALGAENEFTALQKLGAGADFAAKQALAFRFQNSETDPLECTSAVVGLAYYNTAANELRLCNGQKWFVMAAVYDIGTPSNPGETCKAIRDGLDDAKTGNFWLDTDGPGGEAPFEGYCDMDFEGGGWLSVYNQKKEDYTHSQMWAAITQNIQMTGPQTPLSKSAAIATTNVDLSKFTQVVYGWAKKGETVSRWGTYTRSSLKGECLIDGFCGTGTTIATFKVMPQNLDQAIHVAPNPTYPHVGIGWSGMQVMWGYDKDANANGNWANWNKTTCCNPGNTADVQLAGWRYVIYVR